MSTVIVIIVGDFVRGQVMIPLVDFAHLHVVCVVWIG